MGTESSHLATTFAQLSEVIKQANRKDALSAQRELEMERRKNLEQQRRNDFIADELEQQKALTAQLLAKLQETQLPTSNPPESSQNVSL